MRDQGGGEAHECPTCGEEFPTEEELRQHTDEAHSGNRVLHTVRAGALQRS